MFHAFCFDKDVTMLMSLIIFFYCYFCRLYV